MSKPETMMIDSAKYVREDAIKAIPTMGNRSLVRCRNAGVHVGEVVERTEHILKLKNANRIWRWRGAFTLSEIAMQGVNRNEYTRIACLVPTIELTISDVCEVIPVSDSVDLTEVNN